jgi:hypothetical protein
LTVELEIGKGTSVTVSDEIGEAAGDPEDETFVVADGEEV